MLHPRSRDIVGLQRNPMRGHSAVKDLRDDAKLNPARSDENSMSLRI